MLSNFIKSVVIGFQRRWRTGITQALSIAGTIWLITEITTRVSKSTDDWLIQHGNLYAAGVIIASLVWFSVYSYEIRSVSFFVPTTDNRINIRFGDLFKESTDWLIGVNEFFDSEVGHLVSQESLHGKFIASVYNGDALKFRAAIEAALVGALPIQTARPIQPSAKYEIGTTAVLPNGPRKAFLVAMSHSDLATAKASSTVSMLWDALGGALQSVHDYGNGAPVSMPLIGNGRSRLRTH